jgi:hypothetical protein
VCFHGSHAGRGIAMVGNVGGARRIEKSLGNFLKSTASKSLRADSRKTGMREVFNAPGAGPVSSMHPAGEGVLQMELSAVQRHALYYATSAFRSEQSAVRVSAVASVSGDRRVHPAVPGLLREYPAKDA